MVELPHISNPFKRKPKDLSDEELLEEIEKETGIKTPSSGRMLPPPPSIQRSPISMPMPSTKPQFSNSVPAARPVMDIEDTTMMEKQQVAKLPLFMRVEEYDRILSEVQKVSEGLKSMEDILDSLTKLEEEQSSQTRKWRQQLEATKSQVRMLISHMPETGKLKELVQIKKKQQQTETFKKELSGLGADLRRPAKASREVEEMQRELGSIKSGMQTEMRNLQDQVKTIAEIVKQSAAQVQKQQSAPPKPQWQRTDEKKPW
ncbi:TPA: hypothetical protein H1009_02625 [archaeon]|nr:hypothetical protein [Candidatus Naiadarchaeales archaeon SRR2090153.bin461]